MIDNTAHHVCAGHLPDGIDIALRVVKGHVALLPRVKRRSYQSVVEVGYNLKLL